MECYLSYLDKEVYVDLYFANKDSFKIAKSEIKKLENLFYSYKILVKINLNMQKISPGQLLEMEG